MAMRRTLFFATASGTLALTRADGGCMPGAACPAVDEEEDTTLLSLRRTVLKAEAAHNLNVGAMCPGSPAGCNGDQCCPGVAATGFATFPCPNSAETFTGCGSGREGLAAALAAEASTEAPTTSSPVAPTTTSPAPTTTSAGGIPHITCPAGNGATCAGNECCPGSAATGGKNFPCPSADVSFTECEGGQKETVQALLSALTRHQKYTFLRGRGWVNNSWDLDPEYYIGDAGPINDYGIPTINMQDNGQGFRTVAEVIIPQVTSWPVTLGVASSWDEEATRKWAIAMGKEFKLKGSNVILGPGLNVHRVALGGRNGEYVSGESPYFGARMAKPYVEGVQSQAVLAVAKHYVLNNQETNRDTVDSTADARTMWEVYYPPFEASSQAGAASVMCAYNLVNGVHACGNPDTLNTDLKQDMKFDGWVQSDWWALHSFAAKEGVDQEMPGTSTLSSQDWFRDENLDTLSDAKVDDMVARMLTPMLRHGLFEPRNHVCSPPNCHKEIYEVVATNPEHQALNKELAGSAVILLKNDNVLPLSPEVKNIVLLGPACNARQDVELQLKTWDLGSYYNIGGSGRVIAHNPETILDGLTKSEDCTARDCTISFYDGTDVNEAVKAASDADVVFMCGGTSSTEGHDRATLAVDDEDFLVQTARALKHKKVVALTMAPAVILMPWINDVQGAMNIFLGGSYTGSAFADNIFGRRNPSAKLVVTMPLSTDDTIRPCPGVPCPYTEKLEVGYLALQDKEVVFPFGHGLSYTTFGYSLLDFKQDSECEGGAVCISGKVKNTGSVSGAEIAQLYLTYPEDAGEPAKQLRGFHRTKMLAPGEEETFVMVVTERDLSTYDASARAWKVATGAWQYFVGASSRDPRFDGQFSVGA